MSRTQYGAISRLNRGESWQIACEARHASKRSSGRGALRFRRAQREEFGEIDRPQRAWFAEVVALRVFGAAGPKCRQRRETVDMFADHAEFERLGELRDRSDHLAIELTSHHAFDEAALDLDEIDRQVAQVGEGG